MATGDIDFSDIPDPVRDGAPRAPPEPPPAPLHASPTRSESARRRGIVIGLCLVWIAALVVLVLGLRPDLLRAPVIVQLSAWTLALPLCLFVALSPRSSGFPPGVVALRSTLLGLLALFVGLALVPLTGVEAQPTIATIGGCLSFAMLLALPPLVGAALVLRSAFVNAPVLRGALVGAVCGLAGSIGIHSHCPVVTASHVLVAHGLPLLLCAALGALFGLRRGRV